MITIVVLTIAFYGLGAWLPAPGIERFRATGARLVGGATLFLVLLFLLHVIAEVPLRITVFVSLAIAATGLVHRWQVLRSDDQSHPWISHPGLLLTLIGLGAVALNGGVGYIPYSGDEFSNWLGASRLIHLSGGYEAVRETIQYQGYTPGWRLLVLAPWQLTGQEDAGLSAPIVFVLHVAVASLVFDAVVWALRVKAGLGERAVMLGSWTFLLLFLGAEAMGRLWMYNLLVEQPQIYFLAAALVMLLLAEAAGALTSKALIYVGLAAAGGYMVKAAGVTLLPGLGVAALMLLGGAAQGLGDRFGRTIVAGFAMCLPAVLLMAAWTPLIPVEDCFSGSPLKNLEPETIARIAAMDWPDLVGRFVSAVGAYAIAYKTPLLLAAGVGGVLAAASGTWRASLAWVVFTAVYLGLLAWFHLSCLGPWYFDNLNSIPRFTRVPLQAFHALGLVALAFAVAGIIKGARARRLDGLVRRGWVRGLVLVLILVLAGWQARAVQRSVEDVTDRRYQGIDSRIVEARRAIERIRPLAARDLPERPRLVVIDQGGDNDVLSYLDYFAMSAGPEGVVAAVDLRRDVSFGETKATPWTRITMPDDLRAELAEADMIWPMRLDAWVLDVLRPLIAEPACQAKLPNAALVWGDDGGLVCLAKDAPGS